MQKERKLQCNLSGTHFLKRMFSGICRMRSFRYMAQYTLPQLGAGPAQGFALFYGEFLIQRIASHSNVVRS